MAFHSEDGRLRWHDEPVDLDADSVLATDAQTQGERDRATGWLTELLVGGPMPVRDIRKAADAECVSWRTLERAKQRVGVRSRREGFGREAYYVWELPREAVSESG